MSNEPCPELVEAVNCTYGKRPATREYDPEIRLFVERTPESPVIRELDPNLTSYAYTVEMRRHDYLSPITDRIPPPDQFEVRQVRLDTVIYYGARRWRTTYDQQTNEVFASEIVK